MAGTRTGAPRGHERYGGRQKGAPNRRTFDAVAKLEALGFDPLEAMAKVAMDSDTPLEIRASLLKELAQYVYPKRKALDAPVLLEFEPDATLHEQATVVLRSMAKGDLSIEQAAKLVTTLKAKSEIPRPGVPAQTSSGRLFNEAQEKLDERWWPCILMLLGSRNPPPVESIPASHEHRAG